MLLHEGLGNLHFDLQVQWKGAAQGRYNTLELTDIKHYMFPCLAYVAPPPVPPEATQKGSKAATTERGRNDVQFTGTRRYVTTPNDVRTQH